MTRRLLLVDDDRTLAEFTAEWLPRIDGADIAVDVEEDREYGYRATVALIQLTVGEADCILDPVRLPRSALAPVVEALCMTPSRLVMHGCNNDVTGLKRDFGVGPGPLVDTQVIARFLGHERFGLAWLLQSRFGVQLNKDVRRSNWRIRPLTPQLLAYAREDTAWLVELWRGLQAEVDAAGWGDAVEEECMALADLTLDGSQYDAQGWRKIKGIRQMDDLSLRRLAALWAWRDQAGARLDRHPSRVLAPWALLQIAERGPAALQRGTPAGMEPALFRSDESALWALLSDPPPLVEQPAERPKGRGGTELARFQARMDKLGVWRNDRAASLGLDPGWLAPKGVLEGLARVDAVTPEGIAAVENVRQWRLARFLDEWLALLA